MNIYYLIPYTPNQIRVRPYNLIKYMAKRGHRITLFTLWTTLKERDSLEAITQYCERVIHRQLNKSLIAWNVVKTIPTNLPLQSVYSWHPDLFRLLLSEVTKHRPDMIHIEHLRGSRYGLHLLKYLRQAGLSTPIIWDSVDCITYLFQQAILQPQSYKQNAILRFELPRTKAYEKAVMRIFPHVLVTSRHDKESLSALSPRVSGNTQIHILPNGVDLEYFRPDPTVTRSKNRLIVSGKMSYHANIRMVNYLLEQIMPRVWAEQPGVELWVVGKDPPAEWQVYAHHPGVTITGTVPDLRPYLQSAAISVAPIAYGAGIQNKVLEAMACETPVVATSKAISALQVTPGEHLLVANAPDDFANAVLKLLSSDSDRHRIAKAGRKYVQARHDWDKITASLELFYHSSIDQPGEQI